jgi:hypothetical protein
VRSEILPYGSSAAPNVGRGEEIGVRDAIEGMPSRSLAILETRSGSLRLRGLLRSELTGTSPSLTTGAANGLHMRAVAAYYLTTLPTGTASLIGRPLVRGTLCMRGLTTLAGDITLPRRIHRSETSLALPAHRPSHRQ